MGKSSAKKKKKGVGKFCMSHEFRSIGQSVNHVGLKSYQMLPREPSCLKSKRLAEAFLGGEGGGTVLRLVTAHWGLVLTLLWPHLLPGPGGWTRSTSTTPGDPNTAQLTHE